jgi:heme-degrading monooxygenase HmoA
MEYVRIARYSIDKGTFQEIADVAKTGLLRKFQEQPGFIRYGLADMGDKICVSFSFWTTREDALAAETVAKTWTRETLGDKVELKSSHVGSLAFLEGVLATV